MVFTAIYFSRPSPLLPLRCSSSQQSFWVCYHPEAPGSSHFWPVSVPWEKGLNKHVNQHLTARIQENNCEEQRSRERGDKRWEGEGVVGARRHPNVVLIGNVMENWERRRGASGPLWIQEAKMWERQQEGWLGGCLWWIQNCSLICFSLFRLVNYKVFWVLKFRNGDSQEFSWAAVLVLNGSWFHAIYLC